MHERRGGPSLVNRIRKMIVDGKNTKSDSLMYCSYGIKFTQYLPDTFTEGEREGIRIIAR